MKHKTKSKNVSKAIIPVKASGSCSAYYLGPDFSLVKKESSQQSDSTGYSRYERPFVSPRIANLFYEQNPYHAAAIELKSRCVAGIGYDVVPKIKTDDDYTKDPEYIKFTSFLEKPNLNNRDDMDAETNFDDILINLCNDRFTFGQGYLETVDKVKGELGEIYNLRAYNTYPKLYYNKLYYIQILKNNKEVWYKPYNKTYSNHNGVFVFKNYNQRDMNYGFPEWYPATGDLMADRSILEYRLRKFDNNMMIQFMIIVEGGELDADGLEMVKTFLRNNYKGIENAGKVLYLNSDDPNVKIRIEKIEDNYAESGYIQTREQSRDFILTSHQTPPVLMGAQTKGQLGGTSQIKDLFKVFNETIIRQHKRSLAQKLNALFSLKLGITKFKLEFKELTLETWKEMVDSVTALVREDIIDKNEGRKEINYEPREDDANDTLDENIAKSLDFVKRAKKILMEAK